jgi:hypothetical protein
MLETCESLLGVNNRKYIANCSSVASR